MKGKRRVMREARGDQAQEGESGKQRE